MKTRAKLLSIVLAAVMVIGSAIPAFAAPGLSGARAIWSGEVLPVRSGLSSASAEVAACTGH